MHKSHKRMLSPKDIVRLHLYKVEKEANEFMVLKLKTVITCGGGSLEAGNGHHVPLPDQDADSKNECSPMKTLIKLHAYDLQTFMSLTLTSVKYTQNIQSQT